MIKERKSNFELMRIVAILMIIYYHLIIHGNMLDNSRNINFTFVNEVIKFFVIVHVNLFILLSGYFQCKSKFRLSKVFSLVGEILFYSIIITVILKLTGLIDIDKVHFIRQIFLTENSGQYWFVKIYLYLYCLSPFINLLIDKLDKNKFKKLLIVLLILISIIPFITGNRGLFLNDGFSLYNAIFIYLIGAYFRIYPVKESYHFKGLTIKGYQTILIVIYLLATLFNYLLYKTSSILVLNNSIFNEFFSNIINTIFQYQNPIIIVQASALFLFFESLNIGSNKIINKLASYVLGIYLIHEHFLFQSHIYKLLRIDHGNIYSFRFILYAFLIMLIIFIGGSIIECLRKFIFKLIGNFKVSKNIRIKFKNYFNDLGLKINW